ncbi:ABC transporter substrate-binding protein [Limibaculum sp. FT325]|uniref:MlaC/ttg2D family ABC transporter substrate-binding protein n=1 Tax=Thermohalobaculum sediminis TaxID=2939436 RepID=UPI0020BF9DA1|nr:ABC transporter substrate-binding protein [Limibaculum sediminis]MCL5777925.1 ABC transporter substrate-binding protein [Limibaculum sediminis]
MIGRRAFLGLAGAFGLTAATAGTLAPTPALALAEDEARAVVQAAVDEVLALVKREATAEEKAAALQAIMERSAALPQIARFAAGRVWREMSDDQQGRYVAAFSAYIARIYARRFQEYSGETVSLARAIDAGKKGILVQSAVSQPGGGQPIPVDWLVSDRGGDGARIVDIVIEGVSMATTQREEIGAMFDSRGGDVEKLIEALGTA